MLKKFIINRNNKTQEITFSPGITYLENTNVAQELQKVLDFIRDEASMLGSRFGMLYNIEFTIVAEIKGSTYTYTTVIADNEYKIQGISKDGRICIYYEKEEPITVGNNFDLSVEEEKFYTSHGNKISILRSMFEFQEELLLTENDNKTKEFLDYDEEIIRESVKLMKALFPDDCAGFSKDYTEVTLPSGFSLPVRAMGSGFNYLFNNIPGIINSIRSERTFLNLEYMHLHPLMLRALMLWIKQQGGHILLTNNTGGIVDDIIGSKILIND